MTPPLEEDMERVLWTEAEISARVSELASEISRDLEESAVPVAVVGVATGAFLFLADIVRRVALPVTVDFIRVESYGSGTESSGAPRISSDVKVDVKGKHVVLVEDIVDTGNTLSCLIPHMKSKGACAVSVCTLLDKPVRRKVHFELFGNGKFYRGFEIHPLLRIYPESKTHEQPFLRASAPIILWWATEWTLPNSTGTCLSLAY